MTRARREKSKTGVRMQGPGQLENDEFRTQKREALVRLSAVWQDALGAGIEPEVLAHAALFTAFGDLVATYGEDAVADFAGRLASRIVAGEFTTSHSMH